MAMLPRIKPRTFYDLVIEVAIVRPGPIQGDMVHPYLRRREGKEPVVFPKPELEQVLGKTLGVPLFQEQAMRVAIECAGVHRRRGRSAQARHGHLQVYRRGQSFQGQAGRRQWWSVAMSRSSPRRPSASLRALVPTAFRKVMPRPFALIAYASSWLKCHHPDAFCAGPIERPAPWASTPQPRSSVTRESTALRFAPSASTPPDGTARSRLTNHPQRFAVRLGLRQVRSLSNTDAAAIVAARADQAFASVDDVWRRAGVPAASLVKLAEADGFRPDDAAGAARGALGYQGAAR